MVKLKEQKGFTLIELLLVVVVMGLMLAIIVPRGQRAITDAKYSTVRQNCTELASFGNDWVEQMMLAQDDTPSATAPVPGATRGEVLNSLAGNAAAIWIASQAWVGETLASNWNLNNGTAPANRIAVPNRLVNNAVAPPETSVQGIVDPAKTPINPFNSMSVFHPQNDPATLGVVVPGAIACATLLDASSGTGNTEAYHFLFQGVDSTTTAFAVAAGTTFHAGQDDATMAGLRNGVFFTRFVR